ncbi:MAG: hypothetical protein PVH84_13930 [Candidatus Aminicenantes bacterium]|jgi:hypothetical protein
MRKKITPERIKNNDVDYSLMDFLEELWEDVETSISKDDLTHISNTTERTKKYEENVREVFNFVCEICFQTALQSPRLKRILQRANDNEKNIIENTMKSHKDRIDLLRAVCVREISAEIEKGLTKRQAAKSVVGRHKNIRIQFLRSRMKSVAKAA